MKKILFTAALLLVLATSATAEVVDRIAAVVNNEIVTSVQLEKELAARLAADNKTLTGAPGELPALRRKVLDGLIEEALIRQKIAELGLKASDDEVEAAIRDVQKQNKLTREQLEEALKAQGMGFAEYRETLGKQILRFKLIGREVQSKVEVTNQEIRDYFRDNIDQFREEPSTRLSRLTFPLNLSTPEQLAAVRAKAAGAMARLKQGEEFGVVLQSYKEEGSAEGGDMGSFAEGEITPAFAKAVEDLKDGGISEIVEAAGGLHILKVVEKSSGKVQQFDSAKDEIRKTLMEKKTEERFKSWAEGLKTGAYIDIRS